MKNHEFIWLALMLLMGCTDPGPQVQNADAPTTAFTIGGAVEQELIMSEVELNKFIVRHLEHVELKKGDGSVYKTLREAEGVLLREILQASPVTGLTNKNYSSIFVVCTAGDGYRSLYSWNELFNTEIGDQVFIITSADGEKISEMDEAIMMVSLKDQVNGKRNLRRLSAIEILIYGQ